MVLSSWNQKHELRMNGFGTKYSTSQPRGIITLSRMYKLTTVIVQTKVPSSARPNQGPRAGRNDCDQLQSVFIEYLGGERSRSKRLLLSSADFKVFVVGIHHDRMHVSDVQFPENYFKWVKKGDIPKGNFLMIRRTKSYDLSEPDSRIEACKTILAMMRYLNREWWKSREKCGFLGRNALEWKACPTHNRFSKALCSCIVTIYFMSSVLICCISMHLSKSFLWLLSAHGHFQATNYK